MSGTADGTARAARRVEVSGTVQGVGFRPFVHRTATRLGLDGWVRNAGGRVVVTAAGPRRHWTRSSNNCAATHRRSPGSAGSASPG